MLPYGIVQMQIAPLSSAPAMPPVTALNGGRAICPSPKPARRSSSQKSETAMTRMPLPNFSDLALRALPRVAHLADSPSMMAIALIAQGVSALLPEGLRTHRDHLS
jgi:hypothetical protein